MGVASISALIGFPKLAQADFRSSFSDSSTQSILAQNTPGTMSEPSSGTTSAPNTTNSGSSSLSALDKEFMTKAAQSDNTEIQISKLALQKSQDKTVRNFAQEMIRDHTNSSNQLKQIAERKGFTLPKGVGADNQALVTGLKNTSGSQFNRAYMQGQIQAHTKTEAEYQKYIKQGQDPDLQAFANKISPIVAEHLQMAQKNVAQLQ
ncbi:MAG: DUF4142 domain-containing protein [Aetokthonos hydrillicola CCALA 1050]|nr:DUF4142 domain-containing protein [Aetokthonos hydrillicola CCALA 1050]MBW4589243.1 DUF4142 domain-containing protein [Aetokthonos hydrillicola CCALA 1050]